MISLAVLPFSVGASANRDLAILAGISATLAVLLAAVAAFLPNAALFGTVISGKGVREPVMALTFDDGPSPDTTPRVLDALRDAGARATFFVLGKHAVRHPELVSRMVEEGHEVASHGWSHQIMVFSSPGAIRTELNRTAEVLVRAGAPRPRFFRAPHGFRGPFLNHEAAKLGSSVAGWTKGVFDTARPGAETIAERAESGMRPGAILLLHDADGNGHDDRSQTADALPSILERMTAKGLQPVTVSELADLQPSKRVSWRRFGLLGAIAVAFGAFVFYRADFAAIDSMIESFAGVNLGLVALAIVANVVSVGLKAVVWREALNFVPRRPRIRFVHIVSSIFVGFLVNSIFVARTGEVARAVVLRRRINRDTGVAVSLATLFGTIVAETVVLAASLLLLLAVMVFAAPDIPPLVTTGAETLLGLLAVVAIALGGIALAQRHGNIRDADGLSSWAGRLLGRALRDIHQGHLLFGDVRRTIIAMLAGLTSWAANLIAIWLTLLAFGMDQHALGAAVLVFAVSNLVGIVQLTPGNVAVFQVAIAVALAQAYGVDRAAGLSFGLGLQAIEVGLGAGLGIAFLAYEGLSLADVRSEVSAMSEENTTLPRAETVVK